MVFYGKVCCHKMNALVDDAAVRRLPPEAQVLAAQTMFAGHLDAVGVGRKVDGVRSRRR